MVLPRHGRDHYWAATKGLEACAIRWSEGANAGLHSDHLWAEHEQQLLHGKGAVWPATARAWAEHACRVAGRNFTREEWSRFVTGRSYERTCS